MPGHDIIVIGASAGGVEAIANLVSKLAADIPAAIFVVLHFPSHATSALPEILSRKGPLRASHAKDREHIVHGRIYVAPPDNHLLIREGIVRVVAGPRENGHRPAIDPLFRSAARAYGPRVVGVVLSGVLDDGTAGLLAIKMRGGLAAVQDPADALYPGMPESAMAHVEMDAVAPISELADVLDRFARTPVPQGDLHVSHEMKIETDIAEFNLDAIESKARPGIPSGFGCPDCGGSLWEIHEHGIVRFRCRVGHAWSADSLVAEQNETVEEALWTALRALEERAALSDRMLESAERANRRTAADRFRDQVTEAQKAASVIREVLLAAGARAAEARIDEESAGLVEAAAGARSGVPDTLVQ